MPLPSLKQTLYAFDNLKSSSDSEVADCLISLLRASYNKQQQAAFDKLADKYCDAIDGNDLQQDVVCALPHLVGFDASGLIPELLGYFRSDCQFYELAHAIILLVFPRKRSAVALDTLNDLQKTVLTEIAGSDPIWRSDGDFVTLLKRHGLPITQSKTRQLLNGTLKQR
jgi:hypothetical protein